MTATNKNTNNLVTYANLRIIDKPKQNSLQWKFFDGKSMFYAQINDISFLHKLERSKDKIIFNITFRAKIEQTESKQFFIEKVFFDIKTPKNFDKEISKKIYEEYTKKLEKCVYRLLVTAVFVLVVLKCYQLVSHFNY